MSKDVLNELEDVKPEDDFFEKVLNEDVKIPTDDDEDTGASGDKNATEKAAKSDEDDNKTADEGEDVAALKAKIADLEKERKGQLDAVVKSRQERTQFKSELSQLKDAVAMLLEKRSSALDDNEEEEKKTPLSDAKAKVEFNDDDKAFVDLTEVKEAISAETAKTKQELNELKEQRAYEEATRAYESNVKKVISEDDRFGAAYEELKTVYESLNNQIIEMQKRTEEFGNKGILTVDRALELFNGSPEEEAFLKENPGADPTRIARAFNSKVDLRHGLKHVADTKKIGIKDDANAELDDKIKQAKNKPGSLANQGNKSSEGTDDLIERIASMSPSDFESLSDAEASRIEAMLLREELQGE